MRYPTMYHIYCDSVNFYVLSGLTTVPIAYAMRNCHFFVHNQDPTLLLLPNTVMLRNYFKADLCLPALLQGVINALLC